ncbi:hypothetical protein GOBAR_AA19556 [Gossypium barbadense]|uniref:Retrotransposon gag domain-containing protein n=1 Tax=Gossypium barbadense TaxID=3634 RepID=A0A2P5XCQ0_GOSBA|nr:hypothetical protein GOBAR_AA19556 [Gossypium barbadense]
MERNYPTHTSGYAHVVRGKVKVRANSDDVFPFAPKLVQVELPLFTGKDPEEWLASAHDFFEFYGLQEDIKNEVFSHCSSSMIKEARLHDKRQLGRASSNKQPPLLPTPNLVITGPKFQPGCPPPVDQPNPAISTIPMPRHISSAEA